MRRILLTTLLLLFSIYSNAQKTFCDGWEEGYASGKSSLNESVGIIPICPIAPINEDTYEKGYSKGYSRATGSNKSFMVKPVEEETDDAFCSGWENGYSTAMRQNGDNIFIVPICPIAHINAESYQDGYTRGRSAAYERLNKTDDYEIIRSDSGGTFCEGWEDGYQAGLQIWATENKTTKSLRFTPICPIAPIHQNNYESGYSKGKARALEDME